MTSQIRHFYKLVFLVALIGILVYFQNQAALFSKISVARADDLEPYKAGAAGFVISDKDADLQAQVYRQPSRDEYKTRNLRSRLPLQDEGSELSQKGNSTDLTDDPDTDECSDVHKKSKMNRCHFVNVTDDCQIDEGFLDYTYFVYCDFKPSLLPLGIVILVFWWLFLFVGLAVTADDFFCPALAVIAQTMRLSHNVAGVTFLAFGNGAPDIFSAIAAIGNAKDGDAGLAIGALFGAGVFVTTVVAGTIAIICPFDSMQRPFLRDIIFYLAATFWTFYVLWDKKISAYESVGFIVLYVVYVLVVVIGRYVYTRTRAANPEYSSIQEPTGREIINPLDTVTDGERQPLLSNPDIISLTAVRDTSPVKEFLNSINPINTEEWGGMGLVKKIYEIFKCPLVFFLLITVPVVNYEDYKHHWNRHLTCVQCVLGPVFGMLATKVGFIKIGGTFPLWAVALGVGIILAIIVFLTSKNEVQPKYHPAFAYLGFLIAVIWIYSIANEIVNILQTLGVVFNISNAILGLTLLAWGNSIGDFIADTVMARQGFPRMGISACFGGPLFNLLLGIGIPFTIATVKNKGDFPIKLTLEEMVLAGFLAISLISTLIIVPLSKFRMSRGWGIFLIVLYVVFLTVAILTEIDVIHANI